MTKLKVGDIILAIRDFYAYRDTKEQFDYVYCIDNRILIHEGEKLRLSKVENRETLNIQGIGTIHFYKNGISYHILLMLNQTVQCKDVAHNPKECNQCKFNCKKNKGDKNVHKMSTDSPRTR